MGPVCNAFFSLYKNCTFLLRLLCGVRRGRHFSCSTDTTTPAGMQTAWSCSLESQP